MIENVGLDADVVDIGEGGEVGFHMHCSTLSKQWLMTTSRKNTVDVQSKPFSISQSLTPPPRLASSFKREKDNVMLREKGIAREGEEGIVEGRREERWVRMVAAKILIYGSGVCDQLDALPRQLSLPGLRCVPDGSSNFPVLSSIYADSLEVEPIRTSKPMRESIDKVSHRHFPAVIRSRPHLTRWVPPASCSESSLASRSSARVVEGIESRMMYLGCGLDICIATPVLTSLRMSDCGEVSMAI